MTLLRPLLRTFAAGLALLCLGAAPAAMSPLDRVADGYVRLALGVAQHQDGYLDAYYGPSAWQEEARAHPRSLAALESDAARLIAEAAGAPAPRGLNRRRKAFLLSQLRAVRAKIGIIGGRTLAYADEAEALYGVRPAFRPLADYDPVLARIDALLPGDGPLADRVAALRARHAVPAARLEAVARAAVAECRRRTVAQLALPPGEDFRLEIVHDKPWAAYNWYQGGGRSLMQFNTKYPLAVDRVLETACHEGYPGHHSHNSLLDAALVQGRGWREFTIFPLGTPFFFIAEGIGNYAPEAAFPDAERLAFERNVLYPLAGIDGAEAGGYLAVARALKALAPAAPTIAADYLDGRIDRATAIERVRHYALLSPEQAAASVDVMPHYRSYGINYALGEIMIREHAEAAGRSRAARWRALRALLSRPVVPAELERR